MIVGNLAMRLNITVVAMEVPSWQEYFPAFGEVATTLGVLAGAVLAYGFLLRVLPIHEEERLPAEVDSPAALPLPAEQAG